MARKNNLVTKQIIAISTLIFLFTLLSSCSSRSTKGPIKPNKTDYLVKKYKRMRMNDWNRYTKKKSTRFFKKKERHNPKKIKPPSKSMEHLSGNAIFQQVTQIHCFKIRASKQRCDAIKYLAMINCGEIKRESEIKNYRKCLIENFK